MGGGAGGGSVVLLSLSNLFDISSQIFVDEKEGLSSVVAQIF